MLDAWALSGRYVRVLATLVAITLLWSSATATEVQQAISVMPAPATVRLLPGVLVIAPNFSIGITGHNEPRLNNAARRLVLELRRDSG